MTTVTTNNVPMRMRQMRKIMNSATSMANEI